MGGIRIASIALGAGIAVSGGASAQTARPADCVWAAAAPPMRAAMIAAAPNPQGILNAITDDEALALASACHLPDNGDSAVLVVSSLRAHVLIAWAKAQFKGAQAISDAALDAAWARLPPETRSALAGGLEPGFRPPDSLTADMEAMARDLKVTTDDGKFALFAYGVGRAALLVLSPG
jgi:hypothetical protein